MAQSKQEKNKKERIRYKKDKKFREKKIEYRKKYAQAHEQKEEKASREYYREHPEYRRKKIKQAKAYQNRKKRSKWEFAFYFAQIWTKTLEWYNWSTLE